MSRRPLVLVALLALLALPARAQQAPAGEYPGLETGKMWTFDVPPLEYWAKRYGFKPTPEWLAHAQLAAVRLSSGCSASFVSLNGLVMTNHHCARGCIVSSAKPGEDPLTDGFYAPTLEEERKCEGLVLDQLQEITDVTGKVATAIGNAPPDQAAKRRAETISAIEKECGATQPDAFCQVVTMYRGGQYKLYRFRRFGDVRLVMAPEDQIAFFGGDPDNFTYPRYDVDMSFVRAYVDGKPALTPNYFRWSKAGAKEGDLVFVIGNPGSTGRLNTVAQLEYLRDVLYPAQLAQLDRRIKVTQQLMATSEERGKALRNQLFGLQNSFKAITGYDAGLLDPQLMARKRAWEKDFQGRVDADPELKKQYGKAWQEVALVQKELASFAKERRWYNFAADGTRLLTMAGLFVRYPVEMAKPDSLRLPPFREANRRATENYMTGSSVADTTAERIMLTAFFDAMVNELPSTDPVRRAAIGTRSPAEAAAALVSGTMLTSPDQRRALFQGGADAIAASTDPFIRLAKVIDPLDRQMAARTQALIDRESSASEKVARALLAVFGNRVAPDATFSLRIADGEILRYPMNGTLAPAFTTFYGLYDRNAGFNGEPAWALPKKWVERRDRLDLATPLDAVSTADIIGGNSGSPVINRDAEVVGLIFDGNIEGLPLRFLFSEKVGRAVHVDSRAIVESLRKVYDAGALADELVAGTRGGM